ncbi:MAG: pentapeptide repeat-containing protein, partial [Nostocaceae cyanobacterium CSU_2_110]|nr:pentapeptide repeat-containing protein [Nostocaceae cyanobacterium CSU_2_110]
MANLTEANFQQATLKNTDFGSANVTRTIWFRAKKLDRARVGNTYFQNPKVRELLVTKQGQNKIFDYQNLRGVNLQEANLVGASFSGTDLSEACLQNADLSRAKLVQTQLDNTDFTGATLTGAYIEDWNITNETNFRGVKCEYVYMRLPTEENPNPLRKPDNNAEVFADGEFGDFIQPIFDTLDLYHNQGVDPRAIAISFKELAEKNPDAGLEIVAMEKRGDDKFLLRAKAAPEVNKSELSAEYFETYNHLKSLTASEQVKYLLTELKVKDTEINSQQNQIISYENMINTALGRPSIQADTVTVQHIGDNITKNAQEKNQKDTNNAAVKTILILASNPKNTSQLRLGEEVREIDAGLQRAKKR